MGVRWECLCTNSQRCETADLLFANIDPIRGNAPQYSIFIPYPNVLGFFHFS